MRLFYVDTIWQVNMVKGIGLTDGVSWWNVNNKYDGDKDQMIIVKAMNQ